MSLSEILTALPASSSVQTADDYFYSAEYFGYRVVERILLCSPALINTQNSGRNSQERSGHSDPSHVSSYINPLTYIRRRGSQAWLINQKTG